MKDSMKAILDAAMKKPVRTYLLVFPASGVVQRKRGRLDYVDFGGDSHWTPILAPEHKMPGADSIMAIDPRVMIIENDSLKIAWHPRHHMNETHAACKAWFTANPDVFNHTPSDFLV